ncbi:MAG: response regulator [Rhodospirillaceae bacterium]
MVVDDDEFSRSTLIKILHKLNIGKIREAIDGHQALIDLRALGRIDCMFLDFEMPTLNGLEVLKGIRDGSAGVSRSTSVAMLTAHNNMRLARTAIALDVSAFLSKPASAEVIRDRLQRVLTTRHETKAAEAYASVVLPRGRTPPPLLPTSHDGKPVPGFVMSLPQPRPPEMRVKLEHITPNARITRSVDGPDGAELIPVGTVLSKRLLTHLYDLRELDECVAELWIEASASSVIQFCTVQG